MSRTHARRQLVFKAYWAGILIFLGRGTPVQLTISIASVLGYLCLLSMLQPFRSTYDNVIWTAGLSKLLLTTWPADAVVTPSAHYRYARFWEGQGPVAPNAPVLLPCGPSCADPPHP